ncbi:MAG: filamentous hemagglutinin N-terminal domain-containing protein, partial [Leptolyngbyaceae bacterium]|nr:filamentous hemagglutinin N-terminal domain-containing protein [Leptolyngbyaceae bacterium]
MVAQSLSNLSLVVGVPLWWAIAHLNGIAIAQIIPDNSLGSEHSVINRNLQIREALGDRIDGGAIRGSHLFHSFSDFNVNEFQRVYFSNPASIHNIISRVTGTSQSDIFGTLGVLGNANLFLINPNGLVFGPDATLDINGSFLASTTDSILFDSGDRFSASNPEAAPLLNVTDQIAGLGRWLPQSGAIQSQATLAVGGNLNLLAETLTIQGQTSAKGDINLVATNQLTIADTPTLPSITSAGGNLLLQGNQALTLSALEHPASRIEAAGNLTLRSPTPIVADAIFTAGGNTRIERLDGSLGSLISIGDPVFETAGNFAVDSYTGASLQILAGGSVTIPGTITIESAGGPFNDSTVTLSNGSSLVLTGTTEPTVDIRAGTTEFFGTPDSGSPTRADITIGTIVNPGGLVYLTNRFSPNSDLAGNIVINAIDTSDFGGGGDVAIDSKGGITFNFIDVSGGVSADFDFESNGLEVFGGDGGDVTLLAGGEILMPLQSFLLSYGLRGGSITLDSATTITQEEGPEGAEFFELSTIEAIGVGSEDSGNVRLLAPDILIGGNIFVDPYGAGNSGPLAIRGDRLFASQASINTDTFFGSGDAGDVRVRVGTLELEGATQVGSNSISFEGGATGEVVVEADRIVATGGAQIASTAFAVGNAGTVTVTADEITLAGFLPIELTAGEISPSLIASVTQPGSVGDSGNVTVNSDRLQVLDGAKIGTSSFGAGNGGTTVVHAT